MPAVAGIERRFAHQAMHAGLGAQPAEGIRPFDAYRGALDADDFTVGLFDKLGLETAPLRPAQIHAQQHGRPILRLGAAGSGLNFEEGVVGIHLTRKHAPELKLADLAFHRPEVGGDHRDHADIVFVTREIQELGDVAQARVDVPEGVDHRLQARALAPQLLGALRLVPDVGLLKLAIDLGQPLFLEVAVKDTPSRSARARAAP